MRNFNFQSIIESDKGQKIHFPFVASYLPHFLRERITRSIDQKLHASHSLADSRVYFSLLLHLHLHLPSLSLWIMEGASNGGMLYHEVQESKLCAVHCVNTVLQGPFFSEFDLAALASDLDRKERQMMLGGSTTGDFLSEESHNVSLDGDFSIQVWFPIAVSVIVCLLFFSRSRS